VVVAKPKNGERTRKAFRDVIEACAKTSRKGQDGTWITKELQQSFIQLHELGLAHSVEVYEQNELVGGLYGLSLGLVFFGESMFHKVPNASKVAFYHLHDFLRKRGFKLIDAQQDTAHLRSMGAFLMDRRKFLSLLEKYAFQPTLKGNWSEASLERVSGLVHKYTGY